MTPSCTRCATPAWPRSFGVGPQALRGFLEGGQALPATRTPAEQRATYDDLYATIPDSQSRGELWTGYRNVRGQLSAAQGGFEDFRYLPLAAGQILQHEPQTKIDGAIRVTATEPEPGRPPAGELRIGEQGWRVLRSRASGTVQRPLTNNGGEAVMPDGKTRYAGVVYLFDNPTLAARALRDLQGRTRTSTSPMWTPAGPSNGYHARREPRNPHHDHRTRFVPGRRVISRRRPAAATRALFDACNSAPDTPALVDWRMPTAPVHDAARRCPGDDQSGIGLTFAGDAAFGVLERKDNGSVGLGVQHVRAGLSEDAQRSVLQRLGRGMPGAARPGRLWRAGGPPAGWPLCPLPPAGNERHAPGGVLRSADREVLCRPGGVHPRLGFGRDARRDAPVPTRPQRAAQP